jgi:hypothetical protein
MLLTKHKVCRLALGDPLVPGLVVAHPPVRGVPSYFHGILLKPTIVSGTTGGTRHGRTEQIFDKGRKFGKIIFMTRPSSPLYELLSREQQAVLSRLRDVLYAPSEHANPNVHNLNTRNTSEALVSSQLDLPLESW